MKTRKKLADRLPDLELPNLATKSSDAPSITSPILQESPAEPHLNVDSGKTAPDSSSALSLENDSRKTAPAPTSPQEPSNVPKTPGKRKSDLIKAAKQKERPLQPGHIMLGGIERVKSTWYPTEHRADQLIAMIKGFKVLNGCRVMAYDLHEEMIVLLLKAHKLELEEGCRRFKNLSTI